MIAGASARAAAQSAVRAGYSPLAVDLFGDVDLQQLCPTFRINDYPTGAERIFSALPDAPWLFTGAWENHPDLVDRLATGRGLLGNPGKILRQIRDPFVVAAAFQKAGLPCPRVARVDSAGHQIAEIGQTPGAWLCKPIQSAGGTNISEWRLPLPNRPDDSSAFYLQKQIEGTSTSGAFVADGKQAVFLGASEQLVGTPWTGAGPYGYAGTIGPLVLSRTQQAAYMAIGELIAERFNLRGIFGVDCIVNDHGVWPVEVNPRYTASIEVLERALGIHTLEMHVAACRGNLLPNDDLCNATYGGPNCGKAVLYADKAWDVTEQAVERMLNANLGQAWPVYADIPPARSRIEARWPICTVLASGPTRNDVLYTLQALAAHVRRLLEAECNG